MSEINAIYTENKLAKKESIKLDSKDKPNDHLLCPYLKNSTIITESDGTQKIIECFSSCIKDPCVAFTRAGSTLICRAVNAQWEDK